MKIGISTWVWTSPLRDEDVARLVPHIAALGFDWIELPIERPAAFDYAQAARLIEVHGLGVSVCAVVGADRDLSHPDAAVRANGMAYLRHCIEAAQLLGAPTVVGPLYAAVGRTWRMGTEERARLLDQIAAHLRELAAYAAARGVALAIEPLNRFETSVINTVAQALELLERVDHPACGLLLDTFHMNIEERAFDQALRQAGAYLRHVHACENDRGAPGSGHVPWTEVGTALRAIGYHGPLVIESFAAEVAAIARAAAIWRPLADSPDALARAGLRFLREHPALLGTAA
ncbi:sugar phosphate isomerase/epimerase family protein [Kallotenue papyrolyticum]|uniref:sugar phosphate isomerase/epimerase family protein n=1 Tax=Kallotenue papyrolyticum TaxID=1325125 RepID=UPI000472650B|nr:sugar phosphate isomerase/epimerase [Kallotenue papyrolyticum]